MNSQLSKALILGITLAWTPGLLAQDDVEPVQESDSAERQARITELRELIKQDRQARRQDIEARLSDLSEDERAALQERRRMARQAQQRREGIRGRRGVRPPCECDQAQAEDSSG